jgi:predicted nucleic acid-binding protein
LIVYFDASFLVSLYSFDANSSAAVLAVQSAKADYLIVPLGELEVMNAMELRVFRKEISSTQARTALKDFDKDLRDRVFQIQPLTDQIFERARQLSRQKTARLGTRTADLLHVAAAIELKADAIYTFDQQQRALAQALHLRMN